MSGHKPSRLASGSHRNGDYVDTKQLRREFHHGVNKMLDELESTRSENQRLSEQLSKKDELITKLTDQLQQSLKSVIQKNLEITLLRNKKTYVTECLQKVSTSLHTTMSNMRNSLSPPEWNDLDLNVETEAVGMKIDDETQRRQIDELVRAVGVTMNRLGTKFALLAHGHKSAASNNCKTKEKVRELLYILEKSLSAGEYSEEPVAPEEVEVVSETNETADNRKKSPIDENLRSPTTRKLRADWSRADELNLLRAIPRVPVYQTPLHYCWRADFWQIAKNAVFLPRGVYSSAQRMTSLLRGRYKTFKKQLEPELFEYLEEQEKMYLRRYKKRKTYG